MYTRKLTMKKMTLAVAFTALFFGACKKDDETTPVVEEASVIIKHASPDAPAVDLYVDDVKINTTGVSFNSNTGYLKVKAGTRKIRVTAAGSTTTVLSRDVAFTKDKSYSLFAANRLASIEPVIVEDNLAAPAAGKAHIRFVHLSPDAPNVNIVNGTSTTNLFSGVAFKASTAFTPVDATTTGTSFTFNIRNASTNASVASVPATLMAGKIYTVVIRGFVTPPTSNTNTLGATLITNK